VLQKTRVGVAFRVGPDQQHTNSALKSASYYDLM
jgi:hypothetical protein